MQVFIRSPAGLLAVEVASDATIQSVIDSVASQCSIESFEGSLVYAGSYLSADSLISEAGLVEECTLDVAVPMVGGGKKKKKRTYTKPKKIKHKHKKVKLAVLKYYKVDSNDKVQRLRKACPHELCGAGTFMATHFNRYYCGKCSTTYLIKEGDKK
jgi:small subunit ribosomal protein S27Ae